MRGRRLRRLYKDAEKSYLDGDLGRAAALGAEIVARGGSNGGVEVALAYELQAVIDKDLGNEQKALASLFEAEQLLLQAATGDADLLGRVQFQIGVGLTDLGGADDVRRRYFEKARDTLAGSRRYAELSDAANEIVTDDEESDWSERKRKAQEELRQVEEELPRTKGGADREQGLLWRQVTLGARIALLNIDHGTDDEAEDACIDLAAAATAVHVDDPPAFFNAVAPITYALHRKGVDLSYLLPELLDTVFDVARRSGASDHLAAAHHLRAMSHLKRNEGEKALADALSCVSLSERSIAGHESVVYRAATRAMMEERRHLALACCSDTGRWREAAELIERARLQVLPLGADGLAGLAADQAVTEDNAFSLLLRASAQRLGKVSGVYVDGSSVRDLDQYAPPLTESVDLVAAVEAVGGIEAWWWGTWIGLNDVFAVTRSPSGGWSGARMALSGPASDALGEVERLYHRREELTEDELVSSAIFSPAEEQRLMSVLGEALIPPALRAAIGAADAVLSIVVAGNVLSTLPIPALMVPETSSRRLVEVAVLRIQPPAALVQVVEDRPVTYTTEWPLQVAIVDPTGDLEHARHLDLPARRVLSHTKHAAERRDLLPASVAQVVAELSSPELDPAGTVFYSGHVDEDPLGASVALCLMDDDMASTRLFHDVGGGRPWRLPDRVVVSACGSAGSGGTGGGEWLGFAAGLLFAGARQVVATAWPIPDSPATARFDDRLIRASVSHPDLASGLREAQLEWLQNWLTADVPVDWSPLLWSSFQWVGVRW